MAAANGIIQVSVPTFYGINESRGDNINMGYATYAENMDTRNGKISVAKGFTECTPALGSPIITLARFYRRFHATVSSRNVLVAATATSVYTLVENDSSAPWTLAYTGASSGEWDYVTYEDYRVGQETPVDVLLMTNAQDGMIEIWGDDLDTAVPVTTPAKFGAIARYKERIFGTGAEDEPDRIWYSAPFNPTAWEQNVDLPQNGGGLLDYPTWDGDSFLALRPFGGYLLAFKKETVCILAGADPGEYTIREGYGTDGPLCENTIVPCETACFYLTRNGIGVYDGTTIQTISRDAINSIIGRINQNAINTAVAAVQNGIYMCAVPLDGSLTPNAVIEYDTTRGTFMLRTGFHLRSFLKGPGSVIVSTGDTTGKGYLWGEGTDYNGDPIYSKWVSPWTDVGARQSTKTGFRLRCQAEGYGYLTFSIATERKTKTKDILLPRPYKEKRKATSKSISNKGRQFRFIMENDELSRWEIVNGIQIEVELDAD